MFLSEYADLADDRAFREALGRYQFFPSPVQLKEMFEERRLSNVIPICKDPEFKPSYDLQEPFQRLEDAIGASSFKAWFRGAEAWRRTDGGITVRARDAFRARWIRENYAASLESACGANVEVTY